jgi:transcription elongation factor GreB
MSKAFTKEPEDGAEDSIGDDAPEGGAPLPSGVKNYMTPQGFAAMQDEMKKLARDERPKVVETVAWAAGNGDRSEYGDYIYGKQRLREIDRRIRYLTKRLESAEVVDPARQTRRDQVFFGATVTYANEAGVENTITIVGVDEATSDAKRISWVAPIARALLKTRAGDTIELATPGGVETIEVIAIQYPDTAG